MVFVAAGGGVGVEDRLAERAGAAVGGVGHHEGGQQRPVLHQLEAGPEAEAAGACRRAAAATPVTGGTCGLMELHDAVIAVLRELM